MPRFAANLTTMFQEFEFEQRFAAASDAGFTAVEILSPYGYDIPVLASWLNDNKLTPILINISPGEAGETGTAAVVGRESFFRSSFEQALSYADGLGVPMIHVLAGRETEDASISADLFVENLRWAAELAREKNITLLLEPLNTKDVPGYLHTRRDHTAALIETIGAGNVKMQFDFYHQQIMDGNLAAGLEQYLDIIGHVQFSSLPGRHEPQYGEVNVHYLAEFLDALGYTGWIGCEYTAKAGTKEGLSWAHRYGIS